MRRGQDPGTRRLDRRRQQHLRSSRPRRGRRHPGPAGDLTSAQPLVTAVPAEPAQRRRHRPQHKRLGEAMTTSAPPSTAEHAAPPPPQPRRWLVLGLLSLAQLMLILDVTVVNLALPAIGAGLHLDRATLTWVLTTYTLVFGGLMLLGGRLADLLGARRVMLTGLAVF